MEGTLWSSCPSAAYVPSLVSFSEQLKRARQSWDGYNFGWMPTNNPIVDRKGFGRAFAWVFFPLGWSNGFEKAIWNLSVVMATTFNASLRAFENQQTQTDSLVEVVLQNHRALHLLTAH